LTIAAAVLAVGGANVCMRPAAAAYTAYTWKPVAINGGGFVDGIVFHPAAQNVIYARTDVGGAYRWNSATNAWEQMFNWLPSSLGNAMSIESIAVDPTNANIVYAVGGGNTSMAGTLFASQNQGHTWSWYTLPFVCGGNNDGRQTGERLAVDPNNPAILYYGSINAGLYKSTNRGQTWSKVTSFPVTTTANGVGIPLIQFIKSSGTSGNATPTLYVGVSQTGSNLYRTTNGGSTWTAVYSSSTLMPSRAAQDGAGNMYLTYNNAAGPNGISNGAVIKLNLSTLAASTVLSTPSGWGYGYGSVSVSAQNSNEVIASTIDRWWPNDGLYLSTNGGATWTDTSTNATVDTSLSPWIGKYDPLGSWDGSAQIDPFNSNRVIFGTGGGITIINNLTSSPVTYAFNSAGVEEMVTTGMGVPSNGSGLYMVFGDIGGLTDTNLDTSPPTSSFYSVGGTMRSLDFAELAPSYLVMLGDSAPNRGSYSTNGGASWTNFSSSPPINGYWEGAIAVSASGTSLVWSVGGNTQYYSKNNGATWTQSSGGTSYASYYSCAAVSDRVTDGVFYAYDLSSGAFLKSTNGGVSFSVVSSGVLPSWVGGTPVAVPGIAGDIWLPTPAGLYHSTNSGSNWTQVNNGNSQCIGFGKAASGSTYPTIFAYGSLTSGGTTGLWMSTNAGASWTQIDDPLDEYGVGVLKGDPNIFGRVYIGGLGVHYGDIATNMPVNGPHTITNLNSAMVLDNQSSMASGAVIVQKAASGGASQQWQVTNLGNSRVKILNAYSGMALGISGNSNSNGAAIVQSPWANSPYQIWTLTLQSNGRYILKNVGSGLALDDPGWSTTAGVTMAQWTVNSGANQQWGF